jgi:hemerythrin
MNGVDMKPPESNNLWTKDLAFGIPVIDRDHKMLIEFMEDFLTTMQDGCGLDKLQTTLSFLKDYTNMHFEHEEALMKDIEYDGFEKHQVMHIKFCYNIEKIQTEFIPGFDIKKSFSQTRFLLYTWYTNHIKNTDRQYVALFKKMRNEHSKPGTYKLWDNSMLIGIPEIDREHKALVETIEDLINVISQKKHYTDTMVKRTVQFLKNYTQLHFNHEEIYLEEHKYPDLFNHKILHQKFVNNIKEIGIQLELRPRSKETLQAIQSLLLKWFLNHICDEDQKYAML